MKTNRRNFITKGLTLGAVSILPTSFTFIDNAKISEDELEKVTKAPVLDKSIFTSPVIIESIELLKSGEFYLLRTRSKGGAEGLSIPSNRAAYLYPILQQLIAPFFIGKDARDLESIIDQLYVHNNNYKLSGLAYWTCIAWLEFSVLDMLGKIVGKPVGDILGGRIRNEISMYMASGRRNTTPEEEAAMLQQAVAESGVKAVKFKIGGRMSNNEDAMPGRTEGLVQLVRKTLGDKMVIYADGNGSYDVAKGIEIGRLLESYNVAIYEEPCPFDYFEETKKVADALTIPITGGECENSLRRFRWLIANNALQMVQPDLHYFGGLIRCTKVARMAAKAGIPITVHVTATAGFVDMLHFASFIPNIGPFQEFKGDIKLVGPLYGISPKINDGIIKVPSGPGWGLVAGSDLLKGAKKIES